MYLMLVASLLAGLCPRLTLVSPVTDPAALWAVRASSLGELLVFEENEELWRWGWDFPVERVLVS